MLYQNFLTRNDFIFNGAFIIFKKTIPNAEKTCLEDIEAICMLLAVELMKQKRNQIYSRHLH